MKLLLSSRQLWSPARASNSWARNALDQGSPLDLQFSTEVGNAVLGMNRQDANEVVKRLLPKYEDHLSTPTRGKKYQELFYVATARPSEEHYGRYLQYKKAIADYASCLLLPALFHFLRES
jgi:hypothetical protein